MEELEPCAAGTVEQVDSLKTAYHGAAVTGMDVFRHSFDEALNRPGVVARQLGTATLIATCQACSRGDCVRRWELCAPLPRG